MHKSQHSRHSSSKPISQIPSLYTRPTSSTSSSPFLEQPSLHSSYHGGERLCLQRKAHPQQDKMRQTYRALSSIYTRKTLPSNLRHLQPHNGKRQRGKEEEEEEKHKLRRGIYPLLQYMDPHMCIGIDRSTIEKFCWRLRYEY